jgi:lipopolysaccharide/colanic/teichoic acid biosynthesis glycosyltransferase
MLSAQHGRAWTCARASPALGRNRVSFGEMLALDADYVAHVSLRRDVGLLLRTLPAVARGDKSS